MSDNWEFITGTVLKPEDEILSVEFTDFSTHKIFKYRFIKMRSSLADFFTSIPLHVDFSSASTYGQPITSTFYQARTTSRAFSYLEYSTGSDEAQGTNAALTGGPNSYYQDYINGELILFDPENTSLTKKFMGVFPSSGKSIVLTPSISGYVNTTGALDGIKFYINDWYLSLSGEIRVYGLIPT